MVATGARPGYVFKKGAQGLGYYKDGPLQATPAGTMAAAPTMAAPVKRPASEAVPEERESPPSKQAALASMAFIPPQLLARREEVKNAGPSFQHVTAHSQKPKEAATDDVFAAFLQSVEKQ